MTHALLIDCKPYREAVATLVAAKEARAAFARKVAASAAQHQAATNSALAAGQPPPAGPEVVQTPQTSAYYEKEIADAEYARHRALLDHSSALLEQARSREDELLGELRKRLGNLAPLVSEIGDLLSLKSQVVAAVNLAGAGVERYRGPVAFNGSVTPLEVVMRAMAGSSFLDARPSGTPPVPVHEPLNAVLPQAVTVTVREGAA